LVWTGVGDPGYNAIAGRDACAIFLNPNARLSTLTLRTNQPTPLTMTIPLAMSYLAALESEPGPGHRDLVIVLAFLIALILIRSHYRQRRIQLWHETARLALEKGQPLPPRFGPGVRTNLARWGAWRDLRRGLILLAIGGGLFLARPDGARAWVAVLGCVGTAYLLLGVISLLRTDKAPASDFRDPSPKP
jgi:hypothetical protein